MSVEQGDAVRGFVRHLDTHGSHSGMGPRKRVEDEHWNITRSLRVDIGGESMERARRDLVSRVANVIKLPLRLFVDNADARAGSEVMEAIECDLLPRVGELFVGVTVTAEPCERRVLFSVNRSLLALAHVALVLRLRSHYAAVILE